MRLLICDIFRKFRKRRKYSQIKPSFTLLFKFSYSAREAGQICLTKWRFRGEAIRAERKLTSKKFWNSTQKWPRFIQAKIRLWCAGREPLPLKLIFDGNCKKKVFEIIAFILTFRRMLRLCDAYKWKRTIWLLLFLKFVQDDFSNYDMKWLFWFIFLV